MSEPTTVKAPEIPGELWMLWTPGGDWFRAGWIKAIDDPRDGENYLVALTRADAVAAAAHQAATFGLECIPVRVK